jgi:very-short-patch-repair endonuclease
MTKKGNIPWNKGITKETSDGMKRVSEAKLGDKNPIHTLMSDKKKCEEWKKSLRVKGRNSGTLVERFGEERAAEIKLNQSNAAKKRKIHGHTGHKHSEKSMKIALKKRMKTWKEKGFNKCSKEQRLLYETLSDKGYDVLLEEPIEYYSVDILFPNENIIIEVDGDWWHVNYDFKKVKEYIDKHGDISQTQKVNLNNDKRKNTFLKNKGFVVKRVWAEDINNNIDKVVKEIEEIVNEK